MTNDLMLEVIEGRIPMPAKPKPPTIPADAIQLIVDAVNDIARELITAFRPIVEALQSAGVIATPPPSDPRERALWMTQHRNTGPVTGPLRTQGRNNHYKTKR